MAMPSTEGASRTGLAKTASMRAVTFRHLDVVLCDPGFISYLSFGDVHRSRRASCRPSQDARSAIARWAVNCNQRRPNTVLACVTDDSTEITVRSASHGLREEKAGTSTIASITCKLAALQHPRHRVTVTELTSRPSGVHSPEMDSPEISMPSGKGG